MDRSLVSLGFQTESVRTTLRAIADHSVESGPENQSGPHGPQFSAGDCLLSFARIDPHIDPVPIWMIARPLHRQRRDYGTQIPAKSLACFLGVAGVLGTVLQRADLRDGRMTGIELASRYGNVTIAARGFVDASGDAALTWQAGLPCWVPERPIYGSQQVIVENVDESHKPDWGEIDVLLAARGEEHGLLRRGGLAFFFPGRAWAVHWK